jgi:hypothetical protein
VFLTENKIGNLEKRKTNNAMDLERGRKRIVRQSFATYVLRSNFNNKSLYCDVI